MSNKVKWAAALAAIAVAVGIYFFAFKGNKGPHFKEHPVARGNIDLSIQATGSVQPENRLEIKPPIAGRVEQVLIKEGEKVRKGQILAWMSSSERAALLDAARAQGAAELKRWEELYRSTPVIAPINGTIILRSVESGQTFTTSEAILVMSDRLTVKAQVDETDIAQIKLKSKAQIILDAYPKDKIPGHVEQVAFEAQTVNNVTSYVVGVLPETTPDFMRSGMTANVNFASESRQNILLVPNEAIQRANGEISVLVRGSNGKPSEVPVKLGLSDGRDSEVLEGLVEGDVVLIRQFGKDGANKAGNPFMQMGGGGGKGGGGGRR